MSHSEVGTDIPVLNAERENAKCQEHIEFSIPQTLEQVKFIGKKKSMDKRIMAKEFLDKTQRKCRSINNWERKRRCHKEQRIKTHRPRMKNANRRGQNGEANFESEHRRNTIREKRRWSESDR
jgi:hypothetical protein